MSFTSKTKQLKILKQKLAKEKLTASQLPVETLDAAEIAAMTDSLNKQRQIELKIFEINNEINTKPNWSAKLTKASTINPLAIKWLWPQWIASGKLTILAGAGGTGKTTVALNLAATLTNGGEWPDGANCTQEGNVLIWSSEDDAADTLIPRLIAAGADMDKVHIIEGRVGPKGQLESFDPATDLDAFRRSVSSIDGISLLILDPIVNLIKGDMHKANDVRRSLQGVLDFAEDTGCSILAISHFNKGSAGTSPTERVIGSQAFTAFARTVLVAGKQENNESRVLARAKSNISNDQGGCVYTIELCTIETDSGVSIETTKTVWGDCIEGSASEILSSVENADRSSCIDHAEEALKAILQGGRILSGDATKAMEDNGFTPKQTRRVREKLQVRYTRMGSGKSMKTYWELPWSNSAELALVKKDSPYLAHSELVGVCNEDTDGVMQEMPNIKYIDQKNAM